ncbi:MAG: DUF3231 family protein [Bacillota bacterium]|nr:DUF3231 family protein [Bacillota bacterium]MDP4171955.1 DUF3231 family protein [Bacillota bacterium]
MAKSPSITSAELSSLWMTYQQKTMILRMLEYFIEKADEEESKEIMNDLHKKISPFIDRIRTIFDEEGAAVPIGFTMEDVNIGVPVLFDNGFDIMFVRLMKKISVGMHALHSTMAYRDDIILLFKELTDITQNAYRACTQYLVKKGLASRPPYISMPTTVQFVKEATYLSGLNPFKEKRKLNAVEIAYIYHSIETNMLGMQLLNGFSQTAQNKEVKKFFSDGTELAKSIINSFSKILLESDMQSPGKAGGNVTKSELAPFSDKLMLYCISLLCTFSLGSNAIGTAFSLRKDLPVKAAIFMKDTYDYAVKAAIIMIENGWLEEPPQV